MQYRGRPLVYNGDLAVRPSFLAEQMVGEVSMHYLNVAGEDSFCPVMGPIEHSAVALTGLTETV